MREGVENQKPPSVEKLANFLKKWNSKISHPVRVSLAREAIEKKGDAPEKKLEEAYEALYSNGLSRVINATGVILHTNLGRAPLGKKLLEELSTELEGYSTLEWDKEKGERGKRGRQVERLLCVLTGAESAIAVNNNAAALVLILHTLAKNRSVVVSRGELVQIGGGFRVPEILESAGARLREVGTTNMTLLRDYEKALAEPSELPAMVLKIHPSNFKVTGHTESVSCKELVTLTKRYGIPLVDDLGSGALWDEGIGEPLVNDRVRQGVDLICFSGDKLLGGPQAGIILGKRQSIQNLQTSPLYRALRLGKIDLFLLERTLLSYVRGEPTLTQQMIRLSPLELRGRAVRVCEELQALGGVSLEEGTSSIGGGSSPGVGLPTVLLVVSSENSEDVARALFRQIPAIVPRREKGRLLFDLRTVLPGEDQLIVKGLLEAIK